MTRYATDVFVVHSICGNQIGVRASKIVTVTQGVEDNYCRIFFDNDPEPIVVQESWQEVMFQWTGDNSHHNDHILSNLLKESEEE